MGLERPVVWLPPDLPKTHKTSPALAAATFTDYRLRLKTSRLLCLPRRAHLVPGRLEYPRYSRVSACPTESRKVMSVYVSRFTVGKHK